uniref:cAMP-dependent protein kinase catalytic subunit 1-like n=1 Tax=Diabrotica virgifera virgifera TaxID=50390 RepID=A0A6P7GG51_DIAVI
CDYGPQILKTLYSFEIEGVDRHILSYPVSSCRSINTFILDLQYFFKNNVYIFIVMPFINGGEMFYHLRSTKKFDETLSKFYAAQVTLAFEYMHHMGVVYRDLKPENILIDSTGYLKITDLGFCKKIDSQRTYTLCGKSVISYYALFLNQ